MKNTLLVVIAILVVTAGAFGQAKRGQLGIQTGVTFTAVSASPFADVGGVFMITDAFALRAAAGFLNTTSGGSSTLGYDLGAGVEYHFAGKGGVSPYAGAQLSYSGASVPTGAPAQSAFGLNAVLGAEYFFSTNFAWGGELSIGYVSSTQGTTTTTFFGTNELTSYLTWFIN